MLWCKSVCTDKAIFKNLQNNHSWRVGCWGLPFYHSLSDETHRQHSSVLPAQQLTLKTKELSIINPSYPYLIMTFLPPGQMALLWQKKTESTRSSLTLSCRQEFSDLPEYYLPRWVGMTLNKFRKIILFFNTQDLSPLPLS